MLHYLTYYWDSRGAAISTDQVPILRIGGGVVLRKAVRLLPVFPKINLCRCNQLPSVLLTAFFSLIIFFVLKKVALIPIRFLDVVISLLKVSSCHLLIICICLFSKQGFWLHPREDLEVEHLKVREAHHRCRIEATDVVRSLINDFLTDPDSSRQYFGPFTRYKVLSSPNNVEQ